MASIAARLRKAVGMSTREEAESNGSQENVGRRGKQIDSKMCEAGYEEYCPPKNIPTPTPGDGSRSQKEMKQGMEGYSRKRK